MAVVQVETSSINSVPRLTKVGLWFLMLGLYIGLFSLVTFLWGSNADFAKMTWGMHPLVRGVLFVLVVPFLLIVPLHEAMHGLLFWLYSHRVRFGGKLWTSLGPVFWATSPGSRFSKWRYAQIALVPQVLTILAVSLAAFFSWPAIVWVCIVLFAAGNFAGGVFDYYLVVSIVGLPRGVLIEDVKDGWRVYRS